MRRNVALIVFGIGVVLLIAGFAKLLPGFIPAGGMVALVGALLFGLSFVPQPEVAPDAPPPLSPFERIAGMFYEPTRVFQSLRAHPRWLAALLIVALLNIIYTEAFTRRLTPERIVGHTTEKLKDSGWVSEEQIDKMRAQQIADAKSPINRIGGAISQAAGVMLLMSFLAGLYLLGVLMFGGRINFWQALAALVHAAVPVAVISKLLSLVLLYVKAPEDIHPILGQGSLLQDNLGVLFSPAEHPVLFVLASAIGVLSFYGLWLTAKGLHNAGTRVSSSAAWGTTLTIWVLAILLGAGMTALFPTFIS
ncbi:MAG: YIP1 family protein [Pyrinomonadaceae bacterium]|nr:YIP1 family protein [Pyrinomonadaceae bacterium]